MKLVYGYDVAIAYKDDIDGDLIQSVVHVSATNRDTAIAKAAASLARQGEDLQFIVSVSVALA